MTPGTRLAGMERDVPEEESDRYRTRSGPTLAGTDKRSAQTRVIHEEITLPGFLVSALKKQKLERKDTIEDGQGYSDQNMVFAGLDGGRISPDSLTRAFRYRVKGTEFVQVRLHDLRHTHAMQLLLTGRIPRLSLIG